MAASNTTKLANRLGMDWLIFAPGTASLVESNALLKLDYVNVSNISVTGDRTWATGGKRHRNKIGFDNPMTGTLTLNSQLMTKELLHLQAGDDLSSVSVRENATAHFGTGNPNARTIGYIMKGVTYWKDEDGEEHIETLTVYNATPVRSFGREYNGEGDPQSVEISFELNEADGGTYDGEILTVTIGAEDLLSEYEAFDADEAYHKGDYVVYNNKLYVCTKANGPAAWNADNWDEVE